MRAECHHDTQLLVLIVTRRRRGLAVVARRVDILGVDRVTGRGRGTGLRLGTIAVSDRLVTPMGTTIGGDSGPVHPRLCGVLRDHRRGVNFRAFQARLAPDDRIRGRGPTLGETLALRNGARGSRSRQPSSAWNLSWKDFPPCCRRSCRRSRLGRLRPSKPRRRLSLW